MILSLSLFVVCILLDVLCDVQFGSLSLCLDPWSVVGGFATAALNAYSQSETNAANLQAVREQNASREKIASDLNDANRDLYDDNKHWQEEMWNKQNAYNAPSAQAQRLLQAGINPAMAMGNGQGLGNASSVGNVNPPTMLGYDVESAPNFGIGGSIASSLASSISSIFDNMIKSEQVKGIQESNHSQMLENKFKEASFEARLKHTINSTERDSVENRMARETLDVLEKTKQYRIDNASYENELLKSQISAYREQTNFVMLQQDHQKILNEMGWRENSYHDKQLKQALQRGNSEIGLLLAQKNLTNKQASKVIEETAESVLRQAGIDSQNKHFENIKYSIEQEYRENYVKSRNNEMYERSLEKNPGLLGVRNFGRWVGDTLGSGFFGRIFK